jgi:hypothetical protein
MCAVDDKPLAEGGTELQACEDRVHHLTAEVERLQEQLVSIQRSGESSRGVRDGIIGGGGRVPVGIVNEAVNGILAPLAMPTGREDVRDAHRRRKEVAGSVLVRLQ